MGELEPQTGSMEHLVPPFKLTESANGTNGFMLVGDSGETESLSHHLKVLYIYIYSFFHLPYIYLFYILNRLLIYLII